MKAFAHFCTITKHKKLVLKECFRVGLYKQGLPMICQNKVGQNSVWDADTIRGQEALIMPNGKKRGILPHGSTTKAGTNTIMNTGLIIVWKDRTFWRE